MSQGIRNPDRTISELSLGLTRTLACLILIITTVTFSATSLFEIQHAEQARLQAIVSAAAAHSALIIKHSDAQSIERAFETLRSNKEILYAGIYDNNDELLGTIGTRITANDTAMALTSWLFLDQSKEMSQPIFIGNEAIGRLLIQANTHSYGGQLNRIGVTALLVFFIGLAVIFLLSKYQIRSMRKALTQLLSTIDTVASENTPPSPQPPVHIKELDYVINRFRTLKTAVLNKGRQVVTKDKQIALLSSDRNDGFWERDSGTHNEYFDKHAHHLLGFPQGTLNKGQRTLLSLIHPDDIELFSQIIDDGPHNNNRPFQTECRIKSFRGEWLWVKFTCRHSNSGFNNKAGCISATLRDITERYIAEQQRRLLTAVFESSKEPVIVFDLDLKILAVNTALTQLTNYNEEFLKDCNLATIFSEHHDFEFFRKLKNTLKRSNKWEGEIRFSHTDNPDDVVIFWLSIHSVGTPVGCNKPSFIGSLSDVIQRKKIEDELRYLATYDSLTGLPNRRLYEDRIQHALSLSKRYNQVFAVMFIDLDRFKHINDTLGHSIGDQLLIQVSQRFQDVLRKSDTLARLGGDEFILLLEKVQSKESVAKIAAILNSQLTSPFKILGNEINASASIGISVYPDDGLTIETLLKNADVAMYASKSKGTNGFLFYQSIMNERAGERLVLENDLHKAIDNNELFLVYQPKVDLATGIITGAEVLLRWKHPEMGVISPMQFIPIAEETGLIVSIGEWVLKKVCQKMIAWQHRSLPQIPLALNVSVKQFQEAGFSTRVCKIIQQSGIDPSLIELELTESVLMDTGDKAIETLHELKNLGLSLSIDDFGTGYSSLQYLSKFPIDFLKIDRSFVLGVGTEGKSVTIIRAILAMAKGLDLKVIAEGIEYEPQARLLKEFECDYGQGYYFSHPLREQHLIHFIEKQYASRLSSDLPSL